MKRMMQSPKVHGLVILVGVLLAVVGSRSALGCSVCRCGDPVFNALGLNIYEPDRLLLGLDWERFDKSQGGEEGGWESLVEHRFTLAASYSFSDRITVLVRVPYANRSLEVEAGDGEGAADSADAGHAAGRGLSDPEIVAIARVWASDFSGGIGRRAWLGVQFGVKTPWGENDLRRNGERLDEHVQPGTGSTDWTVGVSGVYLTTPRSTLFGSALYRRPGSNDFGYRYGDITLVNLGFERRLSAAIDGVVELNVRHAERDRVDFGGELDPNTGGSLAYLSPKLLVTLSSGLVARAAVQVPVVKRLYGAQRERTVYSAGLSYVFGM